MEDGADAVSEPSVSVAGLPQENAEAGPSRPQRLHMKRKKATRDDLYFYKETKWYSKDLKAHAKSSRALLEGRSKTSKAGGREEHDHLTGLRRSVVPPASAWDVDEKCRFFAALSRHSRFRPDLIAADVRTKSVMQVQQYLAVLEEGHARVHADLNSDAVERESEAYWDHQLRSGAYEASEAWIDMEETFAQDLEKTCEDEYLLRPLRKRHALDKWGQSLTLDKMRLLHKTLCAGEMPDEPAPPGHVDSIGEDANPIKQDAKEMAMLLDIPKKERTPEERARLDLLKNRKRNRENYRRKKLHAAGFTDGQIEAHGGPDGFLDKVGFAPPAGAPRKEGRKMRELSPRTETMVDMKLNNYVMRRGWELFHFDHITQAMELYHEKYSQTEPSTSFDFIGELFAETLMYIRQLVYTSIVLAEQEPHEGDTHLEATADHVRAAQTLHGVPHAPKVLKAAIDRFGILAGRNEEGAAPNQASSRASTPDSDNSEYSAPRRKRPRSDRDLHEDISSWQSLEKPLIRPPDDGWESTNTSSQTDDEDEEMDQALEAADSALDVVVNAQLLSTAKSSSARPSVDDQAWFAFDESITEEMRDIHPEGVPAEDVAKLRSAQTRYVDLVDQIYQSRAERRKARLRSELSDAHESDNASGGVTSDEDREAKPSQTGESDEEGMESDELLSESGEKPEGSRHSSSFYESISETRGHSVKQEYLSQVDRHVELSATPSSRRRELSDTESEAMSSDGHVPAREANQLSESEPDDAEEDEKDNTDSISNSVAPEDDMDWKEDRSDGCGSETLETLPHTPLDDVILAGDDALDSDSD